MAVFLTVTELPSATRAALNEADLNLLIEDAQARALGAAPCLAGTLTETQRAQVVAIIRGAVSRAAERATRDDRQMSSGPFTIGPLPGSGSNEPRALLWPSELDDLRAICRSRGRAYVGWLA